MTKQGGMTVDFDAKAMGQQLRDFAETLQTEYLRSGAAAAARVLQAEIEQQVPVKDGVLKAAIYRYWDRTSVPGRQTYFVGVNKQKAGHWHHIEFGHWRYNKIVNGRPLRAKSKPHAKNRTPGVASAIYDLPGALAKPEWVPAQPYLRPAFDARISDALAAGVKRVGERMRGEE